MLTLMQRQLLGAYPASMISDTIIDPNQGVSRIKAGQCGGTRLEGPVRCFNTTPKGIVAGWFGDPPQAVVTFTELRRWAESVPAGLRDRIKTVRLGEQSEALRAYKWCCCHRGDPQRAAECEKRHEGDVFYGGRTHPTDEEYEQHLEVTFTLRDEERDLLDEALGLVGEPVGQLDLFDQLMGESV